MSKFIPSFAGDLISQELQIRGGIEDNLKIIFLISKQNIPYTRKFSRSSNFGGISRSV